MTPFSLTRTETGLLKDAAANHGFLQLAATIKPAQRTRLLGRFLREGLVTQPDAEDEPHQLTATAYRAIGVTPPSKARGAGEASSTAAGEGEQRGAASSAPADTPTAATAPSKKAQVLTLLAREQGATLAELIAATGWLPHTARAALSRIRSGGQVLVKTVRPDTMTAYRIPAEVPAPRKRRARRTTEARQAGGQTANTAAAAAATA